MRGKPPLRLRHYHSGQLNVKRSNLKERAADLYTAEFMVDAGHCG